MVPMDQPGACPGNDRAHGHVRRDAHPGHFMAVAAHASPLGSGTWACGHKRRDVDSSCGGGGDAGRGYRNTGVLERDDWRPER